MAVQTRVTPSGNISITFDVRDINGTKDVEDAIYILNSMIGELKQHLMKNSHPPKINREEELLWLFPAKGGEA